MVTSGGSQMEAALSRLLAVETAITALQNEGRARQSILESTQAEIARAATGTHESLEQTREACRSMFVELQAKVREIEGKFASSGSGGSQNMLASQKDWKPVLESKAIQNLTKLGNDKTEYKLWKEKLENALWEFSSSRSSWHDVSSARIYLVGAAPQASA